MPTKFKDVESVSVALETLLREMILDGDAQTVTRHWVPWDQVADIKQPALVIVESGEQEDSRLAGPSKLQIKYQLVCYIHVDNSDEGELPATTVNNFIGKVRTKLGIRGNDIARNSNTLGGLAADVSISGKIVKDAGILDSQASVLIPINVILP